MPDDRRYEARLFRGWDFVRLSYELTDDDVVVRQKHTWTGTREERVPLANLTGDVNRVFARNPANRAAYAVLLVVTLALATDYVSARFSTPVRELYMPLWYAGGAIAAVATALFLTTTKPVQWSHFKAYEGRKGFFVLRDPRQVTGHAGFVARVARRAADGSD